MLKQLNSYLKTKRYFVFDFDRTLAKMNIDWKDWHVGIVEIYSKYDLNHGYEKGKNPHIYHNQLVTTYGDSLLVELREFNKKYEAEHLTGFIANTELTHFILQNKAPLYCVYSSNSRQTVIKGLNKIGIIDKIQTIISRDEVKFLKPNPEGFYMLANFKGNEKEFLMIGDSGADRDAAHAAGIDFLGCNMFEKYQEES